MNNITFSKTPMGKLLSLYESSDMDNVKLALQLTEPFLHNKYFIFKLKSFFDNRFNNIFIIPLLETTWWRKLKLTENLIKLNLEPYCYEDKGGHLFTHTVKEVPKEIGELKNLKFLSLANNQLTSIPEEIRNLTKLEYLYLDHNNLTELPKKINNLKKLKSLYLQGNNLPKEERIRIKKIFSYSVI